MRIGLLADIHANIYGLKEALRIFDDNQVDAIYCAGDIIGYYPFPNRVCNILRNRGIRAIKGNHEVMLCSGEKQNKTHDSIYALEFTRKDLSKINWDWLCRLPDRFEENIESKKIIIVHGSPWSCDEYVYPEKYKLEKLTELNAQLIILAHTHVPFIERVDNTLICNPGSCGQPRHGQLNGSVIVLETKPLRAKIIRFDHGAEKLIKACKKYNFPEEVQQILKTGVEIDD